MGLLKDIQKIYRENKKMIFAFSITIGGILLYYGVTSADTLITALGVLIITLSIFSR